MNLIKYQCSYCNTLYDTEDCCPGCGALREDAVRVNYSENVNERRKVLARASYFDYFYRLLYVLHFFISLSWYGLVLSIPTAILHFVSIFFMRKKIDSKNKMEMPAHKKSKFYCVIRILDMILCGISVTLWILILAYLIYPFEFFGF